MVKNAHLGLESEKMSGSLAVILNVDGFPARLFSRCIKQRGVTQEASNIEK